MILLWSAMSHIVVESENRTTKEINSLGLDIIVHFPKPQPMTDR